jgi:hypothetical protein
MSNVVSLLERRRGEVAARIRELRQLECDLAELGTAGKELDPARCDPSGICGVLSLEHHASGRPNVASQRDPRPEHIRRGLTHMRETDP